MNVNDADLFMNTRAQQMATARSGIGAGQRQRWRRPAMTLPAMARPVSAWASALDN